MVIIGLKLKKIFQAQSYNNDALLTSLFFGYQNKNNFSFGVESFLTDYLQ